MSERAKRFKQEKPDGPGPKTEPIGRAGLGLGADTIEMVTVLA